MKISSAGPLLVLGIGNVLMGDEGVGVHIVRRLQEMPLPPRVECLDGGCGSFHLLEAMQQAGKIILIDATIDGHAPGRVRRLQPRFSADYPRTLTAHDIGLKDLLDAFHLMGDSPDVVLFAISIAPLQELGLDLSPDVESVIGEITGRVLAEIAAECGCAVAVATRDKPPITEDAQAAEEKRA